MPYLLAPLVKKTLPGLWAEGSPYATESIYDLCSTNPAHPPVHYESHALKPHSICHFDAPAHIIRDGKTIDALFRETPEIFYGGARVVRLKNPRFTAHPRAPQIAHWEVTLDELQAALGETGAPGKLLLTFEGADSDFYADAKRAFTVSAEAAEWLVSHANFNLFGTAWKSTDFQPGSRSRVVHETFFRQAGVLECLDLSKVPEGEYFLSAFPLPLEGATESPVCPVLFTRDEIGGR